MANSIMLNVLKMRKSVMDGEPLDKILQDFKEFKESYPKLFELVLENKEDYLPELEEMLGHVELVNTGVASLEDVTKVVKNRYDTKYIYPLVNNNITEAQKIETKAFIEEQKAEVDEITKKWKDAEIKLN
jgi:hypothetical protein